MLISIHDNPRFIVNKDVCLETSRGVFLLDEGEAVSIRKTDEERVFIGNEPGDIIEIVTASVLKDFLSVCVPAEFEEAIDEEGDSYISSTPLLETVSYDDLIARIPITYANPESTIPVVKIII